MHTTRLPLLLLLFVCLGCGGASKSPGPGAKPLLVRGPAVVARPPGTELLAIEWNDLTGHDRTITSAAYSPDGTQIVTLDIDGELRLWESQTGKELETRVVFDYDDVAIWEVDFSPDGRFIAVVSNREVKILHAQTLREVRSLDAGDCSSQRFSRDATKLFVLSNNALTTWNPATGELLNQVKNVTSGRHVLGLSPDERTIVLDHVKHPVRIMDVASYKITALPGGCKGELSGVAFSPDGKLLAAVNEEVLTSDSVCELFVWDLTTGTLLWKRRQGSSFNIDLNFLPDSSTLAAGGQIFEARTGRRWMDLSGTALAVSPDGAALLGASKDDSAVVRLWKINWRKEQPRLEIIDDDWMRSLDISADGKRMAIIKSSAENAENSVNVWDVGARKVLFTLKPKSKKHKVFKVVLSPNSQKLLTTEGESSPKSVVLWDLKTRKPEKRWDDIGWFNISDLAFLPDGKRILVVGGGSVEDKILLLEGEKQRFIESDFDGWLTHLAIAADGKRFVTGGESLDDGSDLRFWDADAGKELWRVQAHQTKIRSMSISADGQQIATLSDGDHQLAKVWNAKGELLQTISLAKAKAISAAITADGKILLVGCENGNLQLWDVVTGMLRSTQPAHFEFGEPREVERIVMYGDGQRCVTFSSSTEYKDVRFWTVADALATDHPDFLKAPPLEEIPVEASPERSFRLGVEVYDVAYSPDGTILAAAGGSSDGDGPSRVTLWDAKTGETLHSLENHSQFVTTMVFSSDSKRLFTATGGENPGVIQAWDVTTGNELFALKGHKKGIRAIDVSSDGRFVASTGWEKLEPLFLWSLQTKKLVRTLASDRCHFFDVKFSPDARLLAVGDNNYGKLKVWEVSSGKLIHELKNRGGIFAISFSPLGDHIAAVGQFNLGEVKLWNLKNEKPDYRLRVKDGRAVAVAFSPNGELLATGHSVQRIVFWDAKTGRRLHTLHDHGYTLFHSPPAMTFSHDGRTLATANIRKKVSLWDVKSLLPRKSADTKSQAP